MQKQIFVIKANGKKVPFDPKKIEATCMRAGASKNLAEQIARKVSQQLSGTPRTREVYRMVLNALARVSEGFAINLRYRLKESIMSLGPAGFAFEIFVGRILENYGYNVIGTNLQEYGRCVKHEVDLVVKEPITDKKLMIECKYHNFPGIYTGLKESLYTHARFLDLSEVFDYEMLVCNTKVSDDVITYAKCIDQKLLCWRYPPDNCLENMIDKKGLYPITILRLQPKELENLSKNKFMLAKDLLNVEINQLTHITNIPIARLQRLQNTVKQIIH